MIRFAARLAILCAVVFAASAAVAQETPPAPFAAETPIESMRKARSFFEYGDYANTTKLLDQLIDNRRFESADLRGEAYRLLGLSDFYLGKKSEAYKAFLEMLYLNPDAELDPFYVPPAAVTFFEQVKKEANPRLEPLRAIHRAEDVERRRLAVAEAKARQQLELEEEQRRLALVAPEVERRVVQREFWVSLLPFGVGQIQNGDRTLGIALATSETIAGATSAGSALLIEGLRDSSTGTFGTSVYPLAQRLNVAKWVGAGIFYALWIGGAIHAAVNYQSETRLPDRLISQSPLATPPLDPLPAPTLPPGLEIAPKSEQRPLAPVEINHPAVNHPVDPAVAPGAHDNPN